MNTFTLYGRTEGICTFEGFYAATEPTDVAVGEVVPAHFLGNSAMHGAVMELQVLSLSQESWRT